MLSMSGLMWSKHSAEGLHSPQPASTLKEAGKRDLHPSPTSSPALWEEVKIPLTESMATISLTRHREGSFFG